MSLFGQNSPQQPARQPLDPQGVFEAFMAFVQGDDWNQSFAILEARQASLLPLPARLLIIQIVIASDEEKVRKTFAQHLSLIEIAATEGIAAARRMVERAPDVDVSQLSTMTADPAQSPGAGPAAGPSRPQGGGDSDLDGIFARLSPEERQQVEAQLRQAHPADGDRS